MKTRSHSCTLQKYLSGAASIVGGGGHHHINRKKTVQAKINNAEVKLVRNTSKFIFSLLLAGIHFTVSQSFFSKIVIGKNTLIMK